MPGTAGCFSVFFSWRQEKNQKNRALRLGLRLPSLEEFFGAKMNSPACGGAQTAFSLFPKNPPHSAAPQWAEVYIDVRSTINGWPLTGGTGQATACPCLF